MIKKRFFPKILEIIIVFLHEFRILRTRIWLWNKMPCIPPGTGTAFTDIYEGEYFPSVGLYKQVHVKFNFGPRFKAPPGGAVKFRPMSERARELEIEQAMADMRFFSEQTNLKIDDVFL